VAHELSKDDLRRFARLGAMRRLEDIRVEEAAIRAAFPELFSGDRPAARVAKTAKSAKNAKNAGASTTPEKAAAPKKARKRSTMSPAMRKAVSERMKKYWAGRRKAKNG
jgi:hypothetical protein